MHAGAWGVRRVRVRTPAADMRDRGSRATRPSDVRPAPSGADSPAMNVARRYPRFRRLLASLAVSQAGDWLYNLALLAFVYERTHSSDVARRHDRRARPADRRLRPARRRRRRPLRPPPADARLRRRSASSSCSRWPASPPPGCPSSSRRSSPPCRPPPRASTSRAVAATTPRLVDDADLPAANAARSAIQQVCIVAGPGFGALLLPRPAEPGLRDQRRDLRAVGPGRRLDPRRRHLRARRRGR